jgi:hypothetical protein
MSFPRMYLPEPKSFRQTGSGFLAKMERSDANRDV